MFQCTKVTMQNEMKIVYLKYIYCNYCIFKKKKRKACAFIYKFTNVVYTHHILLFNIHLNDQSIIKITRFSVLVRVHLYFSQHKL